MSHEVVFYPSGRGKARCPTDPNYPDGKRIDLGVLPNCDVTLPYPAPECGHFRITCKSCGVSIVATAAGRTDDPRSITVPCDVGRIN